MGGPDAENPPLFNVQMWVIVGDWMSVQCGLALILILQRQKKLTSVASEE